MLHELSSRFTMKRGQPPKWLTAGAHWVTNALASIASWRKGNIYGYLLRSYGIPQARLGSSITMRAIPSSLSPSHFQLDRAEASLPFRTSIMVLCILYSLGLGGAWRHGSDDLEVFEARKAGPWGPLRCSGGDQRVGDCLLFFSNI